MRVQPTEHDIEVAAIEGAVQRLRPKLMLAGGQHPRFRKPLHQPEVSSLAQRPLYRRPLKSCSVETARRMRLICRDMIGKDGGS